MQQRLRVASVLDGPIVPAWVHHVLADVAASDARGARAVRCFDPGAPPAAPRAACAFRAYQRLDRRLFALARPDAAERAAVGCAQPRCSAALGHASARHARAAAQPGRDPQARLAAPLSAELSRAGSARRLELRPRRARAAVAAPPSSGRWCRARPSPRPCLARHTSRRIARARPLAAPRPTPTSLRARPARMLWKAASFVARALRDAAAGGGRRRSTRRSAQPARRERAPTPFETGSASWARVALRVGRERLAPTLTHDVTLVRRLRRSRGSLVDGPMDGLRAGPHAGRPLLRGSLPGARTARGSGCSSRTRIARAARA